MTSATDVIEAVARGIYDAELAHEGNGPVSDHGWAKLWRGTLVGPRIQAKANAAIRTLAPVIAAAWDDGFDAMAAQERSGRTDRAIVRHDSRQIADAMISRLLGATDER